MSAARDLADYFASRGQGVYTGGVYDDGLVLYLTVCEETARRWQEALGTEDCSASEDGLVWAFILRGDPDAWLALIPEIGRRLDPDWDRMAGLSDNRSSDLHTIDQFHALVRRVLKR